VTASIAPIARDNLTTRVYEELRNAMMEGRFWPGHRFKIRELAASLEVSETPVREALMQLVREKGLEMEAGRSITVARLSLAQYLELRSIRLHLEGMAGAAAAGRARRSAISSIATAGAARPTATATSTATRITESNSMSAKARARTCFSSTSPTWASTRADSATATRIISKTTAMLS